MSGHGVILARVGVVVWGGVGACGGWSCHGVDCSPGPCVPGGACAARFWGWNFSRRGCLIFLVRFLEILFFCYFPKIVSFNLAADLSRKFC